MGLLTLLFGSYTGLLDEVNESVVDEETRKLFLQLRKLLSILNLLGTGSGIFLAKLWDRASTWSVAEVRVSILQFQSRTSFPED